MIETVPHVWVPQVGWVERNQTLAPQQSNNLVLSIIRLGNRGQSHYIFPWIQISSCIRLRLYLKPKQKSSTKNDKRQTLIRVVIAQLSSHRRENATFANVLTLRFTPPTQCNWHSQSDSRSLFSSLILISICRNTALIRSRITSTRQGRKEKILKEYIPSPLLTLATE